MLVEVMLLALQAIPLCTQSSLSLCATWCLPKQLPSHPLHPTWRCTFLCLVVFVQFWGKFEFECHHMPQESHTSTKASLVKRTCVVISVILGQAIAYPIPTSAGRCMEFSITHSDGGGHVLFLEMGTCRIDLELAVYHSCKSP